MTAQEILTTTKKLKVSLWSEGDKLKYKAPEGVLTDEVRANLRRNKSALIQLLNTPDDVAPAHRWRDDSTGDASATGAAAPDVSASATTGSAAAMATGDGAPDVSAIAPDVLPQLAPDECAALLASYRRGGAVLTLEMVEHDGAQSLALGIELTARVAPEKRARAFQRITNHGLELVRALELEGAPIIEGGAAAMLYAPDDLALEVPQLT
jgi:hypothetical protein